VTITVFKTGGRHLSVSSVGSTPTRFRQTSTPKQRKYLGALGVFLAPKGTFCGLFGPVGPIAMGEAAPTLLDGLIAFGYGTGSGCTAGCKPGNRRNSFVSCVSCWIALRTVKA